MLGPTASGKTRIACTLAVKLKGEIISVDSRQVYKHLDIGTGKDLQEYKLNGQHIPCHLIDVNEVENQFYLHDFIREAAQAFQEILSREHLPIFCGGTGLYLDALRKDFSFTTVPEQPQLREYLTGLDKAAVTEMLDAYPLHFTATIDRNSKKRMIRGIEIADFLQKNGPIASAKKPEYRPIYIGLQTDREKLKLSIAARLDSRLENGLIEEVELLLKKGIAHERLEQLGLEYKFISKYLKGELTKSEMRQLLVTAILQFSKRQMTWFRKMEKEGVEIIWVDPQSDIGLLGARLKKMLSE